MTDAEIAARRDQLERDLKVLEEAVSACQAHARVLTIDVSARYAELVTRVQGNEYEFQDLAHRLRSIRVGILGLYDAKDANDASDAKKGKAKP